MVELQKTSYIKQASFENKWDALVRKWHDYFQYFIDDQSVCLRKSRKNPFTRTRDYLISRNGLKKQEMYEIRQQIGNISKQEMKDVKKCYSPFCAYWFFKGSNEPAKIVAIRKNMLFVAMFTAFAYVRYIPSRAPVFKVGAIIPMALYTLYNFSRPPYEDLLNCYRMIIEKRKATARLNEEKSVLNKDIAFVMKANKKSLYEVENEMWNKVLTISK